MKLSDLKLVFPLLALAASTSTMFGAIAVTNGNTATANSLSTPVVISCNIATSTGSVLTNAAQTVTVKLSASPASAVVIGTSSVPAALTAAQSVAGAAGNTLAAASAAGVSTIWSTGVGYTINAQQYCASAAASGANNLTFTLTGTGGLTATVYVTLNVTATLAVTATSPVTLACNTGNGTGSAGLLAAAQTVNVQLNAAPPSGTAVTISAGSYTVNGGGSVLAAASPLVVTVPATTLTSSNYNTGINVTVNAQGFCANAASLGSSSPTFSFTGAASGGMTGVTLTPQAMTVNLTVSSGPSPLTVSPSAVSINCTWDGQATTSSHYSPGQAQLISVTGPTATPTQFSVVTSTATSTALVWATLNPTASNIGTQTAGASPYNFTVAASSGCGAFNTYGAHAGTIHLSNGLNLDKVINVTLNIVHATVLKSTLSPTSLTYVKGSGTPGYLDAAIADISGNVPYYFTVDTTSLGSWLTVDSTSGTTPRSIRFSTTSMADTMAPGSYSQSVRVQSQNYGDLVVTIPLQVSNPPSTLTVGAGTLPSTCSSPAPSTQNCTWTIGQPLPTLYITLKSSDAPVPYSITTGGPLAPIVAAAELGGLAYSFGTTIPVTFNQSVFSGVPPGTMLSGTVNITSGTPATTYAVTFNITAQAPGAILSGVSPTIVPTLSPGQTVQVVLTGSGFVKSTDPTQATTVGIVGVNGVGNGFSTDTNFSANVLNPSNILLTITVASGDPLLNFATATTFQVTIGVCNPAGSTCSTPTGTVVLTIGAKPIIQTVTSASTFVQYATPNVAPYDMISIFGTNLCPTCVGPNAVMYGTPQAPNLAYPASLSNTDNAGTHTLKVGFQTHTAAPAGTTLANSPVYAPLLFATNSQINLLVPSAVSTVIAGNGSVDVVVTFATAGGTTYTSLPYTVTAVNSDPGIFTVAADGQGSGAILDKNYAVVGQNNPAVMHSSAASDQVQIYMTGLGVPASAADNAAAASDNSGNGYVWSADCIAATGASSPTGYNTTLGAVTGVTPATVDGLILQSSLLNSGRFVPCLDSSSQLPTVTIGGVGATVKYAGWVGDSIAGLYQVNAVLPATSGSFKTATADCKAFTGSGASVTQATALPLCVVTSDGNASQLGVTIWVAPKLVVSAPTTLIGSAGVTWPTGSSANVTVTEGQSSYAYALSSGVLPSGLALNTSSGAIYGTPALGTIGTYPVTVTVTDGSTPPITGSVTFTLTVGAPLTFTANPAPANGSPNYTVTVPASGTAPVTSITPAGGTGPYTFAITSSAPPTDMAVTSGSAMTGAITIASTTPTGTATSVTVTVTDTVTGLMGTFTFTITVSAAE
ncbi:MAG: putative Ig domain-containing protein [Candidatus Solibacter sp.]|jgi:uncharacterized protein (TIGR03437 family)